MIEPYHFQQNTLLGLLSKGEVNRLWPDLEKVELTLGQSLNESGEQITHAYFPLDSIVSLLYEMEDGTSTEIAVVGHEGVVGVSLFMSGMTTPNRAIVQSAGLAYRIKGHLLNNEFNRAGPMQRLLLHYTQALLTQMSQTAVCNRHHSIDKHLCRWLLLSLDRLPGDKVNMTQELIANMLGVRREGVTESAQRLQKAGLISYHRGRIRVIDRAGLEKRVCECYDVVKEEYDRLLSHDNVAS